MQVDLRAKERYRCGNLRPVKRRYVVECYKSYKIECRSRRYRVEERFPKRETSKRETALANPGQTREGGARSLALQIFA